MFANFLRLEIYRISPPLIGERERESLIGSNNEREREREKEARRIFPSFFEAESSPRVELMNIHVAI